MADRNGKRTESTDAPDASPETDAAIVERFYERARDLGLTEDELFPVDVPSAVTSGSREGSQRE